MTLPADYIDNYQRIAREHVAYARANGGGNPFMDPDLVETLETATEALVRRYVTPGSAILDAGCGPGTLLARLDGYQRVGVDMSLDYIQYAIETHGGVAINWVLGRLEQLEADQPWGLLWTERFDAVLCTDVLEHVLDEHAVLRELIRVLKPGGHLIIRVPWETSLWPYIDHDDYAYVHLRKFDTDTLNLLLHKIHRLNVIHTAPVRYPGWDELHAVAAKP